MALSGLLICGGLGTRLGLFSKRVNNKSLALVYKHLVIEYTLNTFVSAGITKVVIVMGGRYAGSIPDVLGDGREFGLEQIRYVHQNEPKGISHAIYQANGLIPDKFAVILGDNFFADNITPHVNEFEKVNDGCRIFLKKVHDPERYGVAELANDGTVINIEEKPKVPKTDLAVTGLYFYDKTAFEKIEALKPSARGELEITDLNMAYVKEGNCKAYQLAGHWSDVGTYDSILDTANYVKQTGFKLKYEVNAWKTKD